MNIMAIFAKIATWFNAAYTDLSADDMVFVEMCRLS